MSLADPRQTLNQIDASKFRMSFMQKMKQLKKGINFFFSEAIITTSSPLLQNNLKQYSPRTLRGRSIFVSSVSYSSHLYVAAVFRKG